ncbi:ANTAR domain-containing protein [Nocardioides sp. S-58]|uniref:ANTAR domain-containing protein n=1 Tax=Nocardioides renjunii TaxID=3095075 RepID=A0ABU5KA87_9ACTN|nr:ANTAR domain-containing protein [Nocardioides sp. S-58]MDZ5661762.1 ANTAR domain-containing protein [Nocardioides sp. S-58]
MESNNERDLRRALTGFEAENRQLREAIESRALTGQAIGILMARLDIDAEVAFSYVRRRSMHENRKS